VKDIQNNLIGDRIKENSIPFLLGSYLSFGLIKIDETSLLIEGR
jgi:hypothetical protein